MTNLSFHRVELAPGVGPLAPDCKNLDYAKTLNFSRIAGLLLLVVPLAAQTCMPGKLHVEVVDSQEGKVFNADIRVSSSKSTLSDLSTGTGGFAEAADVPCGTWSITVSKVDFETATQPVNIAGGE